MALVKFGQLVAGVRGTIGGVTYSANAASPYARAWARGPRSQSPIASAERARLASWAQHWATLTALQKIAWDTYAAAAPQAKTNALGETYYASGWNWYVEINTARVLCGLAVTASIPLNPAPSAPTAFTFYLRATPDHDSRYYVPLASWTAANYLLAYCWVTSRTPITPAPMARYLFLRGQLGSVTGGNYQFFYGGYIAPKLGAILEGQTAHHLLYAMNPDGRCSAPAFFTSTVLVHV